MTQFAVRNALAAFDDAFDNALESMFDFDRLLTPGREQAATTAMPTAGVPRHTPTPPCERDPERNVARSRPRSEVTHQVSHAVRGLTSRLTGRLASDARNRITPVTPLGYTHSHTRSLVPAALIATRQRPACLLTGHRSEMRCEPLAVRHGAGPFTRPAPSYKVAHKASCKAADNEDSDDEVDHCELHDRITNRDDIWRGSAHRKALKTRGKTHATGYAPLDELLVGGGWPVGALTEIHSDAEGTAALPMVLPTLARLSNESDRWIVWVSPPHVPYAPALSAAGVNLDNMLLVHPRQANRNTRPGADKNPGMQSRQIASNDRVWAVEQALRSGTASIVLAWFDTIGPGAMRRLQLAAEAGGTTALIFRPESTSGQNSPAALRLRVRPCPRAGAISSDPRLDIEVLRQRGAWSRGSTRLTLTDYSVDNASRVRHAARCTASQQSRQSRH